jgi:uncharacterized phage infection (PIP) family protein YhgE
MSDVGNGTSVIYIILIFLLFGLDKKKQTIVTIFLLLLEMLENSLIPFLFVTFIIVYCL